MADTVRTILNRLKADAIRRLFAKVELEAPDLSDDQPRIRTRIAFEAMQAADDDSRAALEGIASHILALTARTDHVEQALRGACEGQASLLGLLEEDRSVEERTLNVWLKEPELLDRARNLAMAFHCAGGKFHFRFTISEANDLVPDLNPALEAIRRVVQKIEGGRKAHLDHFEYTIPDILDDGNARTIDHIAIYLEKPASYLMEFRKGETVATPILRRGTKELAIDYDPIRGHLDISGRGFGGIRMLKDVADEFCRSALPGAKWRQVERTQWPLDNLICLEQPHFPLPDGFSKLSVTELSLRVRGCKGAKLIFRGEDASDVYAFLKAMQISNDKLTGAYVRSAELRLVPFPTSDDEDERFVFVRLIWPNGCKFDGATPNERRSIETWLDRDPLAETQKAA
jgi:hypothetical protein